MPTETPSTTSEPEQHPYQQGFAVAATVMGVVALLSCFLLIGAAFGTAGLVLCVVHAYKCKDKPLGWLVWAGMAVSAAGIGASIYLGGLNWKIFHGTETKNEDELVFAPWEGVLAPDITVTGLDGKKIKLSEFRGKRVLLDFWATTCTPCVVETPDLVRLRKDVPENELAFVAVSDESVPLVEAFAKRNNVNYTLASGDVSAMPPPYDRITVIPVEFFIDRNGIIQNVFVGLHTAGQITRQATQSDYAGPPKPPPS